MLGPKKAGESNYGPMYKLTIEKQDTPRLFKSIKANDYGPEIEDRQPVYYDRLTFRPIGIRHKIVSGKHGDALFVTIEADTGEGGPSRIDFPLNWMTRAIVERLSDVEPGEVVELSVWSQTNENGTWPMATIRRGDKSIPKFFDASDDPLAARKSMRDDPEKWQAFLEKHVDPRFEGYTDAKFADSEPATEEGETFSDGDDDLPF